MWQCFAVYPAVLPTLIPNPRYDAVHGAAATTVCSGVLYHVIVAGITGKHFRTTGSAVFIRMPRGRVERNVPGFLIYHIRNQELLTESCA